ncbi:MAG: type I 3-dehydroquinate dehydratase [Methanomicrobium sp.]|nr:type I 3-dehydroquinate dehydratase [Methanomicrobium sp.]MBQ4415865.1 type I 3-dehydroquinate dehydratase [Methanomicrobium sp.]
MKTALSLSTPKEWETAGRLRADFREVRIDLIRDDGTALRLMNLCNEYAESVKSAAASARSAVADFDDTQPCDRIPTIATIRSRKEGGEFDGSIGDWHLAIKPWLNSACDYIDVEEQFSPLADEIRSYGKKIIASVHMNRMPGLSELSDIEKRLRSYGDIVKIVVAPNSMSDAADFVKFTADAKKPIITSIMGSEFAKVRIALMIAGSALIYCHAGRQASAGQYHIADVQKIIGILNSVNP